MKILKVVAYFHHVSPEGGRWDFHEGETLTPPDLEQRGATEDDVARWKVRGFIEETEADYVPPANHIFDEVEAMIGGNGGLAAGARDAAMVNESGANAPEEE